MAALRTQLVLSRLTVVHTFCFLSPIVFAALHFSTKYFTRLLSSFEEFANPSGHGLLRQLGDPLFYHIYVSASVSLLLSLPSLLSLSLQGIAVAQPSNNCLNDAYLILYIPVSKSKPSCEPRLGRYVSQLSLAESLRSTTCLAVAKVRRETPLQVKAGANPKNQNPQASGT